MTTITKATLVSSIWKNFYDRVKDQVTTVTLSISPGSVTVQTYAAGYNDVDFSSSSNFPIILINSPKVPQEPFTFRKTNVNATIDIEVYATNSQVADKLQDAVNNAIETYKGTLAGLGVHNLELDDTDSDFIENGSIKVHTRLSRFSFNYKYTKTRAF